jgi:hypothetical protein
MYRMEPRAGTNDSIFPSVAGHGQVTAAIKAQPNYTSD